VNTAGRPKIVLLGMMTKMPVAGVVWQTVHYLLGLRRLGFDVFYVEEHARTPSMFLNTETDDGSTKAAAFIAAVMRKFDIGPDRWCFHALHEKGGCHGMSHSQLLEAYREAALLINLHGGTQPLPEHYATNRLVYLETDPVQLQIELYEKRPVTLEFLKPHCAFFTFGENYCAPDCKLPVTELFRFKKTRQPVLLDFWEDSQAPGDCFTTIGNWEQQWRTVRFKGVEYSWSKHREFLKFIDLPLLTQQPLELALASYTPEVQSMLEGKGWRVRDAMAFSMDADRYREFIQQSRGEFTVAKEQNVRLRSGWFSDRSATYLAAGRPVITQETGFSNILPSGIGLFGFAGTYDVLAAIDAINSNYRRHSDAARQIAREYFAHDVVLKPLLAEVGL
jgi:hypothetical protein